MRDGIGALTKEVPGRAGLPLPPCEGTVGSLQPLRGLSPDQAGTLISDFQPPELLEIKLLLFVSYPVCGVLL